MIAGVNLPGLNRTILRKAFLLFRLITPVELLGSNVKILPKARTYLTPLSTPKQGKMNIAYNIMCSQQELENV